jgi:hypothetical protein
VTHPAALDAGDITKIGVGVIIALVVIGVLLSMLITALIGRVIIAVVVIALAVLVWKQHDKIENNISAKNCSFTFFGIHLDPPDSLKKVCPS